MKVRIGHLGARMYYGVPRALESLGMLEKLFTDFTINKGLPAILANNPRFAKMRNRFVPDIPDNKIVHLTDYGVGHILRQRNAKDEHRVNVLNYEHGVYLEKRMMADGLKGLDAVCMIGSPSAIIFKAAREKGITTIAEQIIAPGKTYLAIMDKYLEQYKDWETIVTSRDSLNYWQAVSESEWAVEDYLLCGSDFVLESVRECGVDEKKLVMVPYGVPQFPGTVRLKHFPGDRKLRVLFVGNVCIRKGIQYLLEISESVKEFCEIKICGALSLKNDIVEKYKGHVSFEGHISRERIGSFYEWADVFVLPTLFEGSATVCYEAIQYALPIITTRNSGIFLNDGEGIKLIPVGEKEALKKALTDYYHSPETIAEHSEIISAKVAYASETAYQDRLKSFFETLQRKSG